MLTIVVRMKRVLPGRWDDGARVHPFVSVALLSLICVACIRMPARLVEWPGDLPPISYYRHMYRQDKTNQAVESEQQYLAWVIRFYKGWKLYQDGWQATARDIVAGVNDPDSKKRIETKLAHLGKLISAEWAKKSEKRVIRSRELSIWGQALVKALDRGEEESLVDQTTRDVNALLAGQLDPRDITLQRYCGNEGCES